MNRRARARRHATPRRPPRLARALGKEMNATSDYDLISGITEATAIFVDDGGGGGFNNTTSLCDEYFIMPHPDPELAECTSMVCQRDLEILLKWKWWLNGVITIIVAIFGLTGNFVSILVMLQPKLKNSFNQLLIALCVFDSVFIVCNLLNSGPPLGIKHSVLTVVAQYLDIFAHVFMAASVFMIVAFTFERHFAICNPHTYRIHIRTTSNIRHISFYIVPVSFLSIFFNIPLFIKSLQIFSMEDSLYVKINLWLRVFHPLITTGLAPITILVILNVRICKGIMLLHQRRTNRNAKEINMTYIAIAIVTLFVVFNLPRIAAGAHEVFSTTLIIRCIERKVQYIPSLLFYKVDTMARLLMVLNASVNFLVYCAGNTTFKDVFFSTYVPKFCRPNFANRERGDDGDDDDDDEVGEEDGSTRRLRNGPASHAPMPAEMRRRRSKCMEETVVTTCAPDTITNGAIDGKNQLVSSREVEVRVEAPGDDSGGKVPSLPTTNGVNERDV